MNKLQVVFDVKTKQTISIDLDEIIKSRALFQANSGGGKSYLLRKFLEESHGKVQQIIIDPEGEFKTLKEKYDYLLVSKEDSADIKLETKHAPLLAKKLMESGASAILDLYELHPFERIRFVKAFVEALVNLPKNLWHPCIIVIDEIHTFAPETSKGQSESLQAVADLASRGRKRGYALVGATQKLSKFHKDVAAELNTKFTGRCILDIDQKRAAAELGMKEYTELRKLEYEFYAFGPAISGTPILVKAYPVKTEHEDIGSSKQIKAASPDKIKKLMESFKDLPVEAEQELKTKEDLQKKISELTIALRLAQRQQVQPAVVKIDPQALQKAQEVGYQKAWKEAERQFERIKIETVRYIKYLESNMQSIESSLNAMYTTVHQLPKLPIPQFNLKLPTETKLPTPTVNTISVPKKLETPVNKKLEYVQEFTNGRIDSSGLSGVERKILTAVIQRPQHQGTRSQVAVLSGYSIKSSSFANALGHLRSMGLIQYSGDQLIATDGGIQTLGDYEPLPTDHESLQRLWLSKLTGVEQKILKPICDAYPNSLPREECAEKSGYSVNSSSFANALGHLRSTGLVEYVGKDVIATKELFPMEITL